MQVTGYRKKHSESGFSLIEVAIFLMIIGLLMVPLIRIYNIEENQRRFDQTNDSLQYVRESLVKYYVENGRYPTPAPRSLTEPNVAYGLEVAAPFAACAGADVNPCRAGNALIGDVPFKTIGINPDHIVDAYGGKFTYAVTEAMTGVGPFSDTLAPGNGITIQDIAGNNEPQTNVNAHFALVSHGEDSAGTFALGGGLTGACIAGNRDTLNCDNADSVFTTNSTPTCQEGSVLIAGQCDDGLGLPSSLRAPTFERAQFLGGGATYYDDFVYFVTSAQGFIWTYSIGQLDMESRQPGNALIGPIAPAAIAGGRDNSAVAKLEVSGHAEMDSLAANRLCSTDRSNAGNTNPNDTCAAGIPNIALAAPDDDFDVGVFDPGIIAVGTQNPGNNGRTGGGIFCNNQALSGIANSDEECANFAPPAFVGGLTPCPPGTFPVGTLPTGQLDCIVP